jgi:hypothetical protein
MLGASWGITAEEQRIPLGCDELLPATSLRLHRAISIEAPPRLVFRWLCQLRLAPYSYDLLDNFPRRSPRELRPGTGELEHGQRFMSIFRLVSFEEGRQITLRARHTAVSYAALPERTPGAGTPTTTPTDPTATRLLARVLFDPPGGPIAGRLVSQGLALGDLLMMRKQLMTLKELSERDATRETA